EAWHETRMAARSGRRAEIFMRERDLFSRLGRHSSSRTRIPENSVLGELEEVDRLFLADGGEVLEEVVETIATLQVVEERLHRDPGSGEHRRSAEDARRALDDLFPGSHDADLRGV